MLGLGLIASPAADPQPNIIFILADDLGYGDLSCYGQQKFRTPNIDRLAAEGMKFTAHYAGNNVCAPSRCTLLSGKHPGHAYIRDNRGGVGVGSPEGQEPVPVGELILPLTLKQLGYTLGAFGKWGLGPVGSSGDPNRQGFDLFFGYNCQAVAHNYYPTQLWANQIRIALNNPPFPAHQKLPPDADPDSPASYARYTGNDYAPDVIGRQALQFIRDNRERPFFLFYATTVPHLALQVLEDSLQEFIGRFPVLTTLNDLNEEDLVRIMTEPQNSIIKQYQKLLQLDNITLEFEKEALSGIAKKAMKNGTGARALKSVLEQVMLDLMFELPSMQNVKEVIITGAAVENRGNPIIALRESA